MTLRLVMHRSAAWIGRARSLPMLLALLASAPLLAGCGEEDIDTIPPARIDDLSAAAITSSGVSLAWTAPGDDGGDGTAAAYDLRFGATPLSEATWDQATAVSGEPQPQPAGTPQSMTVTGLAAGEDHVFALRAVDEAENWSPLSNPAPARTPGPSGGWIVDAGGGGHFLTIGAAVAAAADGDTIRIRPGTYAEALDLDHRVLSIFGSGADSTRLVYASETDDMPIARVRGGELALRDLWLTQEFISCGVGLRCSEDARVEVEDCALIRCGISIDAAELALRRCTLWGTPPMLCDMIVPLLDLRQGVLVSQDNIVGGAPQVRCAEGTSSSFTCTDFWQVSFSGACASPVGSDGNIGRDPLFADPAGSPGDFHLQAQSPCLEGQTPGCGRMGAFGGR